jgi:mitochondrial distribution and morphology protein 31
MPIEYVARMLSGYLTQETGIQINFESAIVPKWKDSRISFKKVSVSRNLPDEVDRTISSQESIVQFTIDSVDVTLSLLRWLEGNGIIQDAVIKGVRGEIGMDSSLPSSSLAQWDIETVDSLSTILP